MDYSALEERYDKLRNILLGAAAFFAFALLIFLFFFIGPKPAKIKKQFSEIKTLQEKLISSQITARDLKNVQTLIQKNIALSAQDTLAKGASLPFLTDLTRVMDLLRINLVSLEPMAAFEEDGAVLTPYRMEIVCNYNQLAQLVNKMEKSPRFISVKALKVDNYFSEYFSEEKVSVDQTTVTLEIQTLTLVKERGM
jgi:Tfp pilus assembly protein PilO